MKKGQKVVLFRLPEHGKGFQYDVRKLVNRIEPTIGSIIEEHDVKRLIDLQGVTVEITGPKV